MKLLKKNIIKNIEIALTLDPLQEIYLLNHQDCGAIKAYLSCSNYPNKLGDNNKLEIEINIKLLTFAKQYIEEKFKNINNVRIGLIDINGTVADYNTKYSSWNLIFRGSGNNIRGLWYNI
jgi:carbonic anhydrase